MRSIFGQPPRAIAVKLSIGEMAAAGGAQLVAAVRAIADEDAPSKGLWDDGKGKGKGKGAQPRARRALVNSFGAGGNFFAAVLESAS